MGDEGKTVYKQQQQPPVHEKLPDEEPSTTVEGKLREAIYKISSLISLSHTIKSFAVKWQMIRTKLEELNSSLVAAESCISTGDKSTENQRLSDLVQAISQTLGACHNLAHRCLNVSYSGKLLMQSDLDLICANFDTHIKDLSGIYSAGILSNGFALVVSKPGFGASREDIKFYVMDILTRLKVGNLEMKRQALISLNEIVLEDEKYVKVVVDLNEAILVLAKFLDSSDMEIQEESVKVVCVISGFSSYRSVLVGTGVIAPLIRVLESGSCTGKEFAIKSLQNLTENSENAWSLSAQGGVTALLSILCTNNDQESKWIGPACGVLINLVNVDEIKRFMIEEGAICTFIELIKSSKDETTQVNSIEFLQAIAFRDDSVRDIILKEGGIRALVGMLDPKSSSYSYKSRETSLKAVENLCFSSIKPLNLLINHGFLDQLLNSLRKGEGSMQELALKSACRLSSTSEDAKKAMGDAGFMSELVKFLDAKSYEIREMAAEVLCEMIMVPKNRKKFVKEERNVGLIVQCLVDDDDDKQGNFKSLLLSILLAISGCSHTKRKIANSEYVMKKLGKLAGEGVPDAKKIIKKVSSNRFQRMFSRIIHT